MISKKIWLIFGLALAARALYFWLSPARPVALDDAQSWDGIAVNLIQGKGFLDANGVPTSVRPPIYPLFLAGIYRIFGHRYLAAQGLQILLSSLTCVLIFLTARKALGERASLAAGILCALHPPLIVYSTIIGSETLYVFLLTFTIYLLTEASAANSPFGYALAGLSLGVSNLCRSTLTLFPFFYLLFLWFFKRGSGEVKNFLVAALLSFLILLPWTIRNYKVFGEFLLVNISAGQLFWLGTIEETGGRFVELDYEGYRQFDQLSLERPIEAEKANFAAGIKNIRKNPWGYVKLTFVKFFRLWFEPIGYTLTAQRSLLLARLLLAGHCLFILLAFYGIWATRSEIQMLLPVYALFLYFSIMHNIVAPMPRFRLPVEPYLVLFAVSALFNLKKSLSPQR